MQPSDKINGYLEAVRQQIRWKRAQPIVLEEINNHLTDQKDALLKEGLDEAAATDKAIKEMGDPVMVGEQLDQAHRPKPDWTLLTLTGAMLLLGFAIQFFIDSTFDGTWGLQQQMVWAGIAITVMLAAYFADFTIVGKYPKTVFFTLCAITIVFCFFTGTINGRAFYAIYPLLLFPTAFAGLVYSMRNQGYGGLILCGAAFLSRIPVHACSQFDRSLLCVSCLIILTAAVLKGWFNVRKRSAMLILYIPTAVVLSVPFIMLMLGTTGIGWRDCDTY